MRHDVRIRTPVRPNAHTSAAYMIMELLPAGVFQENDDWEHPPS